MTKELKIKKIDKKSIIWAILLGDGTKSSKNIINFSHTDKQKEYCLWKINFLRSLGFEVKYSEYKNVNTNKGVYNYYRGRVRIDFGDEIDKRMYRRIVNGRPIDKHVPKYIIKRLHPLALLIWFMDDGGFYWHRLKAPKNGITRQASIAINSFDEDSCRNIIVGLKEAYDLNLKLHKDRGGYRLYFSATEFRKFIDIVNPYIYLVPESMKYKFCMRYVENRLLNSKLLCEKYNLCGKSCDNPDVFCIEENSICKDV